MTKTVAVIGLNGTIGKILLEQLSGYKDYFNLPIRAITRDISKLSFPKPQNVELYQADFDDTVSSLSKALNGVDVLIDLTTQFVSSMPLIDVAVKSGVKVFFASEYGLSYVNTKYPNTFKLKSDDVSYARSQGLKTVQVQTGLFAESNLGRPYISGIDVDKNTYRKIDGGDFKHSITFIPDLSRSIIELAHMNPSEIPDEVLIESDSITTNYLAQLWEKYNDINLTIEPVSKDTIKKDASDAEKNSEKGAFPKVLRAIIVDNEMDYSKSGHNEFVNPGERKFKWSKVKEHAEGFMTGKASAR